MNTRLLLILFGLLFVVLILNPPSSEACTICVPYPEQTLTDRLLDYDEVVFSREVPDTPYWFEIVETVSGLAVDSRFELFCDSATRRKLLMKPESVLVLARKNGDGKWDRMAYADREYQKFIRAIVLMADDWADSPGNKERLHFFARYLASDHPQIHQQAYLEIGRAPYAMIKWVARDFPVEKIYALLGNYRFIDWHNLYILMLGQSSDPGDRGYIAEKVRNTARVRSTINLAAWLTAFMESHPENGVDEVAQLYFANRHRTREELEQVMASMSVLGSQQGIASIEVFKLRYKIIKSFGLLLENYPAMAGEVAKNLAMWQVQAHVDRLSTLKGNEAILDDSAMYLVNYYLSLAPRFRLMQSP